MAGRIHKRQINDYYCGPAVIQMTLAANGIRTTQKEAAARARTNPEHGTATRDITKALVSYGLAAEAADGRTIGDLKRALKAGKQVIVCYTERYFNWGHYSIVVGFKGKEIVLLDPAEYHDRTPPITIGEFARRWQDPLFTKSDHWAAFVSRPEAKLKNVRDSKLLGKTRLGIRRLTGAAAIKRGSVQSKER